MERYCDCEGWKRNIKTVSELLAPYAIGYPPYAIGYPRFCMWCGNTIKERPAVDFAQMLNDLNELKAKIEAAWSSRSLK